VRDFRDGVLGLDEVVKAPALAARGGRWFRGADIEPHLGVEEGFRPARKAHPGLLSPGWTDGRRGCAPGAPVRFDEDLPGMSRFCTEDLHGNRLELLEPR
jgi:hypothetical protein